MMSNELINDFKKLLKRAKLSSYEIHAYLTLLRSSDLTARELSEKSKVPTGRIYEILEELKNKGMIEIKSKRPKIYSAFSFNQAVNNLLSYLDNIHTRKTEILSNEAKTLEAKLYDSNLFMKKEPTKIFWSTAYGGQSIMSMYVRHLKELKRELLLNDFVNKYTLKVLQYGRRLFNGIISAVERGVNVKLLWSFEHDERPLSETQKENDFKLYQKVNTKLKELLNLSSLFNGFEMRYIYKKMPANYDIFDRKRIIFKIQDPLIPSRIYTCMNVLDPILAEKLRERFLSVWTFEAINERNEDMH
ncbi:MAG: TrmB family transcriptional regulator [Candidatus Hermodarchaeota archaeon]